MSTPSDNPLNPDGSPRHWNPTPPLVIPGAQDVRDETQRFRESIDLSQTVNAQVQSTEQLLTSMVEKMGGLAADIRSIPEAFADTTNHIKRSAEATEQLAKASRKVTSEQERGRKEIDKTRFSIKDMIGNLSQGNIGGAIGEAFQGIPGTERTRGRLTNWGQAAQAAGVARGGAAGLGLRGAGILAGASAGLLTPAALYGAYRAFNDVNQQRQESLRVGALTGEGSGAGFAASGFKIPIFGRIGGEAGALRGTPFDLISSGDAMEIVKGVRGAGFRGSEARATEEAIGGMINDLGIGVSDAMAIAIPAIKDAGLSTKDLAEQMSTLDDTAKSSRIGINDLTKSIGSLITDLSTQSRAVAQAATGTTQDLLRQFQGTLAGRAPGTFAALQSGTQREALATLSGFAPFEAYTPEFSRNFQKNFTRVLIQIAQAKPEGLGWNLYVHEILLNPMYQQLFGNTPIPQIMDMLRKAWEGSNHGTQTSQYLSTQSVQKASRRTDAVLESFKTSTKVTPINTRMGAAGSMGNINLVRQSGARAEQRIAQILGSLGLSDQQRSDILAPIHAAVIAGDKSATENAIRNASAAIKDAQDTNVIRVQTTVGFDPRSARMLKSLNTGQINALRGQSGTQGTDIHQ